jgi:hypothetical protein
MLAKIKFDTGKMQSSATAPATASHTGSSPTSNASHGGESNAGSSLFHGRVWPEAWQWAWSASILLALVSLILGLALPRNVAWPMQTSSEFLVLGCEDLE